MKLVSALSISILSAKIWDFEQIDHAKQIFKINNETVIAPSRSNTTKQATDNAK